MAISTSNFITEFNKFVENPQQNIYDKFPVLPITHNVVYIRNYANVTIGVICGIFSVIAYKNLYNKAFICFSLVAAVLIIYSSNEHKRPTSEFTLQCKNIDALFNPYIECFKQVWNTKSKHICNELQTQTFADLSALETAIQISSEKFNIQIKLPDSDLIDFKKLSDLARTLSDKKLEIPSSVSAYAKQKFIELQKASQFLVHGYPKPEDEKPESAQPYVYACLTANIPTLKPWDNILFDVQQMVIQHQTALKETFSPKQN